MKRTLLAQLVIVAVCLAAWESLAGDPTKGNAFLDELLTGRPSKIAQQLWVWLLSGVMAQAAWVTLQEAAAGFVLGGVAGMVLGFAIGSSRLATAIFAPLFYAAYSVPRLALIPMFLLWFGLGMQSKVAMVSLLVFFLTFFNSYAGAKEVDDELVATTRMMGASRWQVLLKVTLPSAVAWVSLGLQISVPHAFTGAIVAEIVAGNEGLGQLISKAGHQFNPSGLFAGIFAAVVLASTVNWAVGLGSRYLLRWRLTEESSRQAAGL